MRADGFTLLELLVVIAVIGVLLAAVPGFVFRDQSAFTLEGAARKVADGLRRVRSEAVLENREQVFTLDVEAHRFRAGDERPVIKLDRSLSVAMVTARSELLDEGTGSIRFFPNGSSTGGRIALAIGDRHTDVTVDWLTGMVAIDASGLSPTFDARAWRRR